MADSISELFKGKLPAAARGVKTVGGKVVKALGKKISPMSTTKLMSGMTGGKLLDLADNFYTGWVPRAKGTLKNMLTSLKTGDVSKIVGTPGATEGMRMSAQWLGKPDLGVVQKFLQGTMGLKPGAAGAVEMGSSVVLVAFAINSALNTLLEQQGEGNLATAQAGIGSALGQSAQDQTVAEGMIGLLQNKVGHNRAMEASLSTGAQYAPAPQQAPLPPDQTVIGGAGGQASPDQMQLMQMLMQSQGQQ